MGLVFDCFILFIWLDAMYEEHHSLRAVCNLLNEINKIIKNIFTGMLCVVVSDFL